MLVLAFLVKPWEFRGRRTERNAPRGTRCHEVGCTSVKPTPAQAKCTVCHEVFGGVTLFDRHRNDGWCVNPADLGFHLTDKGVWRMPLTEQDRESLARLRGDEDE